MRKGFTLIEMALASVIAALLMAAVLMVLTSISRDRERVATTRPDRGQEQSQLVELIRRDLVNAKAFGMSGSNTLVLQTFGSLDPLTLQPLDRPAQVTYRIQNEGPLSWLTREQRLSDDPAIPKPLRSLVALHVQRLEVASLGQTPNAAARVVGAMPAGKNGQDQVSQIRRVRLRIDFEDGSNNIDQIVCLR